MRPDDLFGNDSAADFGLPPARELASLPAEVLLPPAVNKGSPKLVEILASPGDSAADTVLDELAAQAQTEGDEEIEKLFGV